MRLELYRHLWGVTTPIEKAVPAFAAEGYAGLECPLAVADDAPAFGDLLAEHRLTFRGMAFTTGATVAEHVEAFARDLKRAEALGVADLTVHGGVDAFDAADADRFYAEVLAREADSAVRVAHETHRGKILFNPWRTRDLLERFDALHVCCDFSHFVNVAERLDWDAWDGGRCLAACAARCRHVHARVGYAEGPQVPDPSAPEHAGALAAHYRYWDALRDAMSAAGRPAFTVTPEFGPPMYLHTLPHTNAPVADLAKVCRWMADRLIERYGA